MKNKKTLYHFILDKSWSMQNCFGSTIKAFKEQLENIKRLNNENDDQEIIVSFTAFNTEVDHLISDAGPNSFSDNVLELQTPNGMTALLDAIGTSVQRIERNHGGEIEADKLSVIVLVLTDGYENSSRLFTYPEIAQMVKRLEVTRKWVFNFLGAEIDAYGISKQLNIQEDNVIQLEKNKIKHVMKDVEASMDDYIKMKKKGIIKSKFIKK